VIVARIAGARAVSEAIDRFQLLHQRNRRTPAKAATGIGPRHRDTAIENS
jgi:hypothetical protein